MSRWSRGFTLVTAIGLPLLACERAPSSADDVAPADATYGGTLVVAVTNDFDHMNSLVSAERWSKEVQRGLLFVTLLRYTPELDYQSYLAESWELIGDTAAVFRLRQDLFWHDGVKTTAHDVAFTYERAKDPATAFPDEDYFTFWDGVQVVDSFTIRFRFRPHAEPLAPWTSIAIMPRHLLEAVPSAELRQAPFNKKPIGNGPFRFVSYQPNDRWVFEASPGFPRELGGRPFVDRLVFRVIREGSAAIVELLAGNVDLLTSAPAARFKELDANPDVRGLVKPGRTYSYIGWNGRRPPFGDARVRRAMTLAIDRQEILNALRAGHGQLTSSPIPPHHWAFDPSLTPLPHDPEGAQRLLAEAGFQDRNGDGVIEDAAGKVLSFGLKIPAANEFNQNVATMIQSQLAAVGVKMDIVPTEFPTLVADISGKERRFDAALLGWEQDFRLNIRNQFHSAEIEGPFQMGSYRNPEVDRIIEQTAVTVDREEARPLWHRFQRIMIEDQPYSFLYFFPDLLAVRERVRTRELDIRGVFNTLPRWWIAGAAAAAD